MQKLMLVKYHDDGPDEKGERRYTLFWVGQDANRYGTLASQEFHGKPKINVKTLKMKPGESDTDAACRILKCKRTKI